MRRLAGVGIRGRLSRQPFPIFKAPVFEKSAWPVNKTNMKMLIKLFGDDQRNLEGKKIKLEATMVSNPQTGELVPSLAVGAKQQRLSRKTRPWSTKRPL
jgi:hypothetical protein